MNKPLSDEALAVAREYFSQPIAEVKRCENDNSPFDKAWAQQAKPEIERAVNRLAAIVDTAISTARDEAKREQRETDAGIAVGLADQWRRETQQSKRIKELVGMAVGADGVAAAIRKGEG